MVGLMVLLAAGLGLAAEKASSPASPAPSAVATPLLGPTVPLKHGVAKAAGHLVTLPAAARALGKHGHTGVLDLRTLAKPGAALAGKTHDLLPGGTLRFVVKEQVLKDRVVNGLGEVTAPAGVTVKRTVLKAAPANDSGGLTRVEYRISLPVSAKPGLYEVKTAGVSSSAKNAADWSFHFSLRVTPHRPGEPRPL